MLGLHLVRHGREEHHAGDPEHVRVLAEEPKHADRIRAGRQSSGARRSFGSDRAVRPRRKASW